MMLESYSMILILNSQPRDIFPVQNFGIKLFDKFKKGSKLIESP